MPPQSGEYKYKKQGGKKCIKSSTSSMKKNTCVYIDTELILYTNTQKEKD